MNARTRYLLDANVFIEAHRRYYAFDLCPGFWNCLIWHHEQGTIGSIDRVKQELESGNDPLKQWATKTPPPDFFASTADPAVASWFAQMVTWVQSEPQFFPSAKADFAAKADGWLIAKARLHGMVLVTHEVLAPQRGESPSPCPTYAPNSAWRTSIRLKCSET